MTGVNSRNVSAFVVLAAGTLSGCAAMRAYHTCGYGGCGNDPGITADIKEQLGQRRDLGPPDRIYVQTFDGVVYLSGEVLTAMQRDSAETVAEKTTGVTRVVDTLFVDADTGR